MDKISFINIIDIQGDPKDKAFSNPFMKGTKNMT